MHGQHVGVDNGLAKWSIPAGCMEGWQDVGLGMLVVCVYDVYVHNAASCVRDERVTYKSSMNKCRDKDHRHSS